MRDYNISCFMTSLNNSTTTPNFGSHRNRVFRRVQNYIHCLFKDFLYADQSLNRAFEIIDRLNFVHDNLPRRYYTPSLPTVCSPRSSSTSLLSPTNTIGTLRRCSRISGTTAMIVSCSLKVIEIERVHVLSLLADYRKYGRKRRIRLMLICLRHPSDP